MSGAQHVSFEAWIKTPVKRLPLLQNDVPVQKEFFKNMLN
jgi:hypothetical protein